MSRLPIEDHDSSPTVPLTEVNKARCSEFASGLDMARTQGYIEAHFAGQLIEWAREFVLPRA